MNDTLPLKIDLHVHTCYSDDCATTIEEVISYSKKRGLSGVAITDHNTVEGALKLLKKKTGLIVIPGIEVSTNRGHILGINVAAQVPKGLSVKETIKRIHEAGGISIAAHPSAVFKDGIGLDAEIASLGLDAVEVINSSDFPFFLLTYLNRKFANSLDLPQTAGSDSHLPETIGLAYTIMESMVPKPSIEDVVQGIKKGITFPSGKSTPWMLRFKKLKKDKKWVT